MIVHLPSFGELPVPSAAKTAALLRASALALGSMLTAAVPAEQAWGQAGGLGNPAALNEKATTDKQRKRREELIEELTRLYKEIDEASA